MVLIPVRVHSIVDGDTIRIIHRKGVINSRCRWIDCPEMPSKWGQEAKKFLEDLIDSNKELFFIEDYGADKYGRLLADWFIGSRELNIQIELLRQGLAYDLLPVVRYNLPKRGILLCQDILMAQYEAYQGNLGIWGDPEFILPGVRRLF